MNAEIFTRTVMSIRLTWVKERYMNIDEVSICARNAKWTHFLVPILDIATPAISPLIIIVHNPSKCDIFAKASRLTPMWCINAGFKMLIQESVILKERIMKNSENTPYFLKKCRQFEK